MAPTRNLLVAGLLALALAGGGEAVGVPQSVAATTANGPTVTVTWTPPTLQPGEVIAGYKVTAFPTAGVSLTVPPFASPDQTPCFRAPTGTPAQGVFVWGRTGRSQCAEALAYGPCADNVPAGTTKICNSWPTSLFKQTHQRWSQIFFSGTNPVGLLRLDSQFTASKTLAARFNFATTSGEQTTWRVSIPGRSTITQSARWQYTNNFGGFKSGTGTRFSNDDGAWTASNGGTANGNGSPNNFGRPFFGQANFNSGDGQCANLWIDSSARAVSNLNSALFFDDRCDSLVCTPVADSCKQRVNQCCDGACIEARRPDGTLCESIGLCQAGVCTPAGPVVDVPGAQLTATISGIEGRTSHNVSVAAVLADGTVSAYAVPIVIVTADGPPIAPPQGVQAATGAAELQISASWQPPPAALVPGVVSGYKVVLTRNAAANTAFFAGQAGPTLTVDVGNVTAANVSAAFGALDYDISVLAYTIHGDGPASSPVTTESQSGVPIVAPASISATPNADNSLTVDWTVPSGTPLNASLTALVGRAVSADKDVFEDIDIATKPGRTAPLPGARTHNVTLSFASAFGTGPPSAQVTVTLPEGVPFDGPAVTVTPLNATAFRVNWVAPAASELNGVLAGYRVRLIHTGSLVATGGFSGDPAALPEDRSSCLSLPAQARFVFGRTTATQCAENLGYGPCPADVPAGQAKICNSWPAALAAQTHTDFSQLFYVNNQARLRIDYAWQAPRTLEDRFNTARLGGEATTFRVSRPAGATSPPPLSGRWRYSDNMGAFKSSGSSTSRFANDDGLWMASPSVVNGNRGTPTGRPLFGHGNRNSGDSDCRNFFEDGVRSTSQTSLRTELFFDYSCDAVGCPAGTSPGGDDCSVRTGGCCNGQCLIAQVPDGTVCDRGAGMCAAGQCVFTGQEVDAGLATSLEIDGLLTFEPYLVAVTAYTAVGNGPFTDAIGRTGEGPPTGPPLNLLVATGRAPLTVLAAWEPPVLVERRGILAGYKVLVQRHFITDSLFGGAPDPGLVFDVGNTTVAEVPVGFGGLLYNVSVLAYTSAGDGPLTAPEDIESSDGVPAVPPMQVTATPRPDGTALDLAWSFDLTSLLNATITAVDVVATSPDATFAATLPEPHSNGTVGQPIVDGSGLVVNGGGVLPVRGGRTLSVTLRLRSSEGAGPPSRPVSVAVPDSLPTATPGNVRVTPMGNFALQVEFDAPPPDQQNGRVQGYRIAVLPTQGLTAAAPLDELTANECLELPPADQRFIWGRTDATRCAERLGFAPCTDEVPEDGRFICTDIQTAASPRTHSGFSQLFFEGANPRAKLRIDYGFQTRTDLEDRFTRAAQQSEPTDWQVIVEDATAAVNLAGMWKFSASFRWPQAGAAELGFSPDDGLWMAAPGVVDGDSARPLPTPFFGHGNSDGSDDSCANLFVNSNLVELQPPGSLNTALFFDESCNGVQCPTVDTPCRKALGVCCNGQCVERSLPAGAVCGDVSACDAGGQCNPVGSFVNVAVTGSGPSRRRRTTGSQTVVIPNLTPGAYNISVVALNSAGASPASTPVPAATTDIVCEPGFTEDQPPTPTTDRTCRRLTCPSTIAVAKGDVAVSVACPDAAFEDNCTVTCPPGSAGETTVWTCALDSATTVDWAGRLPACYSYTPNTAATANSIYQGAPIRHNADGVDVTVDTAASDAVFADFAVIPGREGVIQGFFASSEDGNRTVALTLEFAGAETPFSETFTVMVSDPLLVQASASVALNRQFFGEPFPPTTGGTLPITFALDRGTLPDGIAVNNATGRLEGTPTELGSFVVTISATDALGAKLVVEEVTLTIGAQNDCDFTANGPGGMGCGTGTCVDTVPFDGSYTCDCSGVSFNGANCLLSTAASRSSDSAASTPLLAVIAVLAVVVIILIVVVVVVMRRSGSDPVPLQQQGRSGSLYQPGASTTEFTNPTWGEPIAMDAGGEESGYLDVAPDSGDFPNSHGQGVENPIYDEAVQEESNYDTVAFPDQDE